MPFHSILLERGGEAGDPPAEPAFFTDLNLDQVVDSIVAGREEYDLKPFFYRRLRDVAAVEYRHEIMRDLENAAVFETVTGFARSMRAMREHLAQSQKLHYKQQKERWFAHAVEIYCQAIQCLAGELSGLDLRSRGLQGFRDYVLRYTGSDAFASLSRETKELIAELADVKYSLNIKGAHVRVRKYEGEADYSAKVEATFAKFKQGAVKDHRTRFPSFADMNHVEAQILELVARLYPDAFRRLAEYCIRHQDYLDDTIRTFDREVQFYIAYLEFIKPLRSAGLAFCYPQVSTRSKDIDARAAFDLALANKLASEEATVVRNDFQLRGPERIIVVTGPNQGGKTTFARMFGQLHYLASLGYLVPAEKARLFLPDRMFAHFEREEDIRTLRGKLADELVRIHEILGEASGDSIVIMNESFASTTLRDSLVLGRQVLRRIIELESLCVCVTFVDELASLGPQTVSMVGLVDPQNPATRTYEIVRLPADGLAYAAAIARKYGLTYERLKERLEP